MTAKSTPLRLKCSSGSSLKKPVESDTTKEEEGNGHDKPPQPIHNGFHFRIHNKLIFILLQVH